jgi:hypothetical protein
LKYSLVQHSAATVSGKPGFACGVELTSLSSAQAKAVASAGGVVTDSYSLISDLEETVNYPDPDAPGLYPHANGHFLRVRSLPSPLYVPTPEERAAIDVRLALLGAGLSPTDATHMSEAITTPEAG